MGVFDIFTFIISILLIIVVMMQSSKDDINDAFSGGKTELFKNQKTRGFDLVLQRTTLVLGVLFILFVVLARLI